MYNARQNNFINNSRLISETFKKSAKGTLVDFKKAYDSVRREVLYNILIEFGVPLNLVRLIKMCLNESYSEVRIGKHLSGNVLIQNGLKQGDALSTLLFNLALEYWGTLETS
jgi:hypothetical protein